MQRSDEFSNSFLQLEDSIKPLLKLAGLLTALETTFVTFIDTAQQRQKVIWVEGSGDIQIEAGSELNWADSMCRILFNNDAVLSTDVQNDYPQSPGAALGMQTFLALPVSNSQHVIGSLCAASAQQQNVAAHVQQQLALIAEAISLQLDQWQQISRLAQRYERTRKNLHEVKQQTVELAEKVNTDSLTGLLNRRGFKSQWTTLKQQHEGESVAVIAIDLDNFKVLNDTHGHALGDELLAAFGQALIECSRDTDICARMGGDEFFWVLNKATAENAKEAAERLRVRFQALTARMTTNCTLSIGIKVQSSNLSDDLLLHADKVMYKAKARGRAVTEIEG